MQGQYENMGTGPNTSFQIQQQFNAPQGGFNAPPQMGGQNMPPQLNQAPQNFQPQFQIAGPLDKIMGMGGIFIKQKVNVIEALTGCVQQNQYNIFSADSNGEQNSTLPFMSIKENSDCCQRQCLPSACRATELNFTLNVENGAGSGQWMEQLLIKSRKECKCVFLCCNRPEMEVLMHTPQGEQLIGTIKNPFYLCDLGVETYQGQGKNNMLYNVIGGCCQLGVLCPMPCKPCQEVDFTVNNNQGQQLVPLKKKSPGCWRAFLGPTDYFSVVFPTNATRDERILLICSALMLDYMYFNDRPDQNKNEPLNNL